MCIVDREMRSLDIDSIPTVSNANVQITIPETKLLQKLPNTNLSIAKIFFQHKKLSHILSLLKIVYTHSPL